MNTELKKLSTETMQSLDGLLEFMSKHQYRRGTVFLSGFAPILDGHPEAAEIKAAIEGMEKARIVFDSNDARRQLGQGVEDGTPEQFAASSCLSGLNCWFASKPLREVLRFCYGVTMLLKHQETFKEEIAAVHAFAAAHLALQNFWSAVEYVSPPEGIEIHDAPKTAPKQERTMEEIGF
jgi:hypothetical protein